MPTTIFRPTSPTNQNRPKISNFCVFLSNLDQIWTKINMVLVWNGYNKFLRINRNPAHSFQIFINSVVDIIINSVVDIIIKSVVDIIINIVVDNIINSVDDIVINSVVNLVVIIFVIIVPRVELIDNTENISRASANNGGDDSKANA